MSKITFRADDALVEQLDTLDASKSEVMREALREFLDRHPEVGTEREVAAETEERLTATTPELNLTISLEGADGATVDTEPGADVAEDENACKQCGATLEPEHSFCPECGTENRSRSRCECGEEIRADWTFCPGCGRRSPASELGDRA